MGYPQPTEGIQRIGVGRLRTHRFVILDGRPDGYPHQIGYRIAMWGREQQWEAIHEDQFWERALKYYKGTPYEQEVLAEMLANES